MRSAEWCPWEIISILKLGAPVNCGNGKIPNHSANLLKQLGGKNNKAPNLVRGQLCCKKSF